MCRSKLVDCPSSGGWKSWITGTWNLVRDNLWTEKSWKWATLSFGRSHRQLTSTIMADSIAPLSQSVLRNLADKLYEKRKTAALEVPLHFAPPSSSVLLSFTEI